MAIRRIALACVLATLGAAVAAPSGFAAGNSPFGHSHKRVCGTVPSGAVRCHADVVTDSKGRPLATSTPSSGYLPADLQSAYSLTSLSSSSGAGRTIAVVDAYDNPNAASDLATYRSQFGLPPLTCASGNPCFRKINQSGGTTYPAFNSGWAQEISLDLDMASAICPHCDILLVEATNNLNSNLDVAVDRAVTEGALWVSNSYGGTESSGDSTDAPHYDHAGVAITASTGDSGYGVQTPAAFDTVIAVGGTSLVENPTNPSVPRGWKETAWSGAGSGCSAYFSKPSWQTDSGCSNRTVADVSAVANPNTGVAVYDTNSSSPSQQGWMVFGGTSASSPIVASYLALKNQTAPSFPYSNPGLFNDVTSGSNGNCGGSYLCTAGPGFDGPTGLGSINGVVRPGAVTSAASSVGSGGATLNGTVNPHGSSTTAHFEYGTTTAYGSTTSDQAAGNGTANVSESVSIGSLTAGTTYHYRMYATNCGGCAGGTEVGADRTFTTSSAPGPPVVTTGSPTSITSTSATVNGTVNPNGSGTDYHFEYGGNGTAPYPSSTTPAHLNAGSTPVNVSATLSGLSPSTTVHYRLVATNGSGTTNSSDATFTTASTSGGGGGGSTGGGGTGGTGGTTGTTTTTTTTTPTTTTTTTTPITLTTSQDLTAVLPGVTATVTAPQVTMSAATQRLGTALRRGYAVTVRCSAACSIRGSLLLSPTLAKRLHLAARPVTVARGSRSLTAAGTTKLTLKFTRKARNALAKVRSVALTLRVTATNEAGSAPAQSKRVRLRR